MGASQYALEPDTGLREINWSINFQRAAISPGLMRSGANFASREGLAQVLEAVGRRMDDHECEGSSLT